MLWNTHRQPSRKSIYQRSPQLPLSPKEVNGREGGEKKVECGKRLYVTWKDAICARAFRTFARARVPRTKALYYTATLFFLLALAPVQGARRARCQADNTSSTLNIKLLLREQTFSPPNIHHAHAKFPAERVRGRRGLGGSKFIF